MAAIAVGCSALLILFSVFNGFNAVIDQFYTAFYTDLRIRPATGKTFHIAPEQWQLLRSQPGVLVAAPVLEDRMLASGTGDAVVATVRGVDARYFDVAQMQPYIRYGQQRVSEDRLGATALVGIGIASRLGLSTENVFSQLHLYAPNPEAPVSGLIDPTTAFRSEILQPNGIFAIESDFDEHYILAPLSTVQRLLGAGDGLSQIDLKLAPGTESRVVQSLRKALGPSFRIETRQQQNATFYSIMAAEKWTMYLILLLVLLIASFNLVGALSMLVLEKQKDIAILQAMGADRASIRSVFLLESLLWSGLGGLIGIGLAIGLCLGQQSFGWIQLQGGFLIDAYPVSLQAGDIVVVFGTALGLGLVAGWWPSWRATRQRYGILR
jgi:lipoprotein-releasing system permease protein